MPFASGDSLLVTIKRATNLQSADWNGLSDPYCSVQVKSVSGKHVDRFISKLYKTAWNQKTSVIKKDLNPVWNEKKTFYSLAHLENGDGILLSFKVYDWDMLSRDVSC